MRSASRWDVHFQDLQALSSSEIILVQCSTSIKFLFYQKMHQKQPWLWIWWLFPWLQIVSTAMCYSDLYCLFKVVENDFFPIVLGHEAAGIVESVGPGVTDFQPGQFLTLNKLNFSPWTKDWPWHQPQLFPWCSGWVLGRDLIAFVQRVVLIVNCGVQIFTFSMQVNVVHQRALGQYAKAERVTIYFSSGDKVVPLYLPQCGECRFCESPKTNQCDVIWWEQCCFILTSHHHRVLMRTLEEVHVFPLLFRSRIGSKENALANSRLTCNGHKLRQFMDISTFSEYTVTHQRSVAKVDPDAPLDKVCLLGCAVPTGYGAAVNIAKVCMLLDLKGFCL